MKKITLFICIILSLMLFSVSCSKTYEQYEVIKKYTEDRYATDPMTWKSVPVTYYYIVYNLFETNQNETTRKKVTMRVTLNSYRRYKIGDIYQFDPLDTLA